MNIIEKIKAQQIADALERGEENPYLDAKAPVVSTEPARLGLANKIKATQLAENPDFYGVDMATGSDESKSIVIGGRKSGKAHALYEQLQVGMLTDIARIKTVPVLEEKQAIKRTLLPAYLPFVNDYVANGHDYPCDVAVQVMIWLFDVDDIENALRIGLHLVKTGHNTTPPKWARTLEDVVTDAMYDWANSQLKDEHSASPYLDQLVVAMTVGKWDMHPLMLAKSFVMLAKHKAREGNYRQCLVLCGYAETLLGKQAGVKGLKALALKNMTETGVETYIRENS